MTGHKKKGARRNVDTDVAESGIPGAAPAWRDAAGSHGLGICASFADEHELVILSFLSPQDLARASATSRAFRALADAVCCARLRAVMGFPRDSDVRKIPMVDDFLRAQPSPPRLLDVLMSTRAESYGSTLSLGEAHTAVVHRGGEAIVAFGEGENGQLGGGRRANSAVPTEMQMHALALDSATGLPPRFVAVACGAAHTAALAADGRILLCGANVAGQLGPGVPSEGCLELTPLSDDPEAKGPQLLSKLRFVQVVAGRFFTAAITTQGRVAVLGSGMDVDFDGEPSGSSCLLPLGDMAPGERAVMLAAGAQHLLILSDRNRLFAVGDGNAGKLGLQRNLVEDPRDDAAARARRLSAPARRPHLVALPEDMGVRTIVHLAAGGNHSGFITGDGALYMWGCGRNGELGVGKFSRAVHRPTRVRLPHGAPHALNMSCGKAHTAVLTTCGRIVTFGCGAYSQDGKQSRFWATNAPHQICDGELAAHKPNRALVVCGGRHTAVLDVEGALFTFGDPLCCGRPLRIAAMQGNNHVPRKVDLGGPASWAVHRAAPRFGSI